MLTLCLRSCTIFYRLQTDGRNVEKITVFPFVVLDSNMDGDETQEDMLGQMEEEDDNNNNAEEDATSPPQVPQAKKSIADRMVKLFGNFFNIRKATIKEGKDIAMIDKRARMFFYTWSEFYDTAMNPKNEQMNEILKVLILFDHRHLLPEFMTRALS